MKKILILIFFVISSCGYQPLYKVNKEVDLKINAVELIGEQELSEKVFNSLPFVFVKDNKSLNKIIISTEKQIIESSKNSKGQVTSYRTTLIVKFKILNSKGKIIGEKFSQKEFSYSTDENKFKLKKYQRKIEENLISNIVEDIIIYLNYA